jgi:hypothetical protein
MFHRNSRNELATFAPGGAVASHRSIAIEPLQRARIGGADMLPSRAVVGKLGAERGNELRDVVALVNPFDDLLRAERDQHAERHDRQLPRDRAPAVRRLQLQQPEHRQPLPRVQP